MCTAAKFEFRCPLNGLVNALKRLQVFGFTMINSEGPTSSSNLFSNICGFVWMFNDLQDHWALGRNSLTCPHMVVKQANGIDGRHHSMHRAHHDCYEVRHFLRKQVLYRCPCSACSLSRENSVDAGAGRSVSGSLEAFLCLWTAARTGKTRFYRS